MVKNIKIGNLYFYHPDEFLLVLEKCNKNKLYFHVQSLHTIKYPGLQQKFCLGCGKKIDWINGDWPSLMSIY